MNSQNLCPYALISFYIFYAAGQTSCQNRDRRYQFSSVRIHEPIPYELMDPHVKHGNGTKRVAACCAPFPADHQAAGLLVEPDKRQLSLITRDGLFNRTPTELLGFPHAGGNLRLDTTRRRR
jgi:hypothetical protein